LTVRRRIAFLHTASSNIGIFETAVGMSAARASWSLRHEVRPDLLAAAGGEPGERDAAIHEARHQLRRLAEHADAVVLTCSSLGAACEDGCGAPGGIFRADAALALSSTSNGGRVLALYAAPTSEGPTAQLFQAAAEKASAQVECRMVEGAWAHFLEGRHDAYAALIAQAVMSEYARFDIVALAQTSMAAAVARLDPLAPVRTVPDAVMSRLDALFKDAPGAADQPDARRT